MEVHYNLAAALVGNICGTLILFSILLNSNIVQERKVSKYNQYMTYILFICLIGSISEMIFEVINGVVFPFSRVINLIAKSTNHAESIFAGFLFVGVMRALAFEEDRWPKTLRLITKIICVSGAFLIILNLFTGVLFTISEDNVYSRGPLGQLGLMVSLATLIYNTILLSTDNRHKKNYLRFPVVLYMFPFLVGGGLQMVIPSMRLSNVAFALGVATTHLSVQRTLLYTDAMTGVFNRTYMNYFFSSSKKSRRRKFYGGLMLGINSFRQIDDKYGHEAGNEAIKNAAEILKETSAPDYLIMRYGGDEFILVKEDATIEELQLQKEKINKKAEEFNKDSEALYEIHFAIGTALYETAGGDLDTFLKQADKSLYQDKKEYYEKSGKDRRGSL